MKKKTNLEGQTILITGASSGIGLGICQKLVEKNKVIAVYNKNFSSISKINNSNLIFLKCDLFDLNNYKEIRKTNSKK